jgi:hypothetical protein
VEIFYRAQHSHQHLKQYRTRLNEIEIQDKFYLERAKVSLHVAFQKNYARRRESWLPERSVGLMGHNNRFHPTYTSKIGSRTKQRKEHAAAVVLSKRQPRFTSQHHHCCYHCYEVCVTTTDFSGPETDRVMVDD